MKYLLLSLLTVISANAAEIAIHSTSIYIIIFFLILLLIATYAFFKKKCEKQVETINSKQEEIETLKQQITANEKEMVDRKNTVEKEIIQLNHQISNLERELKEGTKNQIVAEIEALRQKRNNK